MAPLVDGISWHPFYDHIPSDPYQNYPQMVNVVVQLATQQGFTGEYFADEQLWRTATQPGWEGGPPVSAPVAAKYSVRAITMHRGLDINVTITINTFFVQDETSPIHNTNVISADAQPSDIPVVIDIEAKNILHYTFSYSNGERVVAF